MTTAVYKTREYNVKWMGRTKSGSLRVQLGFKDSIQSFWVDAQTVRVNGKAANLLIEQSEADKLERLQMSAAEKPLDNALGARLVTPLKATLLPFQLAGVEYALKAKNVLISDSMGLGKTLEALATIEAANAYPALIITPATMKLKWLAEVKKFTNRRAVALNSNAPDDSIDQSEIIVVNYEMLPKHLHWLLEYPFKALVGDEFHYVKSKKAQRSQAFRSLSNIETLQYRIGLTGTPVLNRPQELVNQLVCLKQLSETKGLTAPLGTAWNFLQRYCAAHKTRFGWDLSGASNLAELSQRLRAQCMIRREKKDVLAELPPKRRVTIPMRLTNAAEYARIEKEFRKWLKPILESRPDLQVLSPAKLFEKLQKIRAAESIIQMTAFREAIGRGKLDDAKAWITDFLESGEKLVVFAYHQSLHDGLRAAFPEALTIMADDSLAKRQKAQDRFQDKKGPQLLIASWAGREGITLSAADNMLLVEYDWTPEILEQIEDRIYGRLGGDSMAATIWYLHAPGTFDDVMLERLNDKREVISTLMQRSTIG